MYGAMVAPGGVKIVISDMLEAISDWFADVPVTLDIATLPDKLGTGLELQSNLCTL
jgi:hypothetical protein